MKKLFSVFLASLLLLQLSLFALADSSKSAAAAQQYSLQVIDNVMQFVKNDKVVRSVSLQNSTINLGKRAASVSLSRIAPEKAEASPSAPRPR